MPGSFLALKLDDRLDFLSQSPLWLPELVTVFSTALHSLTAGGDLLILLGENRKGSVESAASFHVTARTGLREGSIFEQAAEKLEGGVFGRRAGGPCAWKSQSQVLGSAWAPGVWLVPLVLRCGICPWKPREHGCLLQDE